MEGMQEGNWKEKEYRAPAESDPVNALLARMSPDEAIEDLELQVAQDPSNREAQRQLDLLKNRPDLHKNAEGETLH